MNIGIFPPKRTQLVFRNLFFVHLAGAALMTNGKPDETERDMTEHEIVMAKGDEAARVNTRNRGKRDFKPTKADDIALKSTRITDRTPFMPDNRRHFRSRRRKGAIRFANRFGGVIAKHEFLVIKGVNA